MQKRIFTACLALCLAIVCALGLSGCEFDLSAISPQSQQTESTAAQPAISKGDLQVYYLDVGQGDSELLILPDDTTILIDSGDRSCINYITDALHDLNVDDIDILIATHPHADHIGCMATVVRNFDITTIYMPKVADDLTPTTVSYEKLLEAIQKKNLKIRTGKAGVVAYEDDGIKLEFLAPSGNTYSNLNNYSIVAKLTYQETSFLFMGDAEQQVLGELLKAKQNLRCDVLKLGHHGSSNAITKKFMQAVQPAYGIISCGADNAYGHPHQEALQLLQKFDVTTYRTDEDGTILAVSDGKTIEFTTGLPSVLPQNAA